MQRVVEQPLKVNFTCGSPFASKLNFPTQSFISKIRYFDRESFGQRLICQTNKKNSFQRVSRSCEYYKELGPHENNKTTMLPSIYNCLISPCETSLLSVKVQN